MWIVSWPCSIPELVGKLGLQFCDQQCESEQMGWATVACGEKPGKRATDLSFCSIDCCAKRTVWSCRQLQKSWKQIRNINKQAITHTKKQVVNHSRMQAKRQVTSAKMIRIILVVIRFITRTTITTLVLCIRRIRTVEITIITGIDPTITRTILIPIITRDEQTRCADGMRRRGGELR